MNRAPIIAGVLLTAATLGRINRATLILIAAVLATVMAAPAQAQSTDGNAAKFLADQRTAEHWERAYVVLAAVDTIQTVRCLDSGYCAEANPLFGENPKTGKVIAVKVAGTALHYALFSYINHRDPRVALRFAQASVVVQGGAVVLNLRFALK
jgi:hypothetical protein